MLVKNKIFPYPVLNRVKQYSNFGEYRFNMQYEIDENKDSCILKNMRFETDSKVINSLYDKGIINVFLIIECSKTVYRKKIEIGKNPQDIELHKNDLTERVEISMFAVVKKDFKLLSSDEFDCDYRDIEYELETNNILCVDDGFNLIFDHNEYDDNLKKSIFAISFDDKIVDGRFEVDLAKSEKKIVIFVSEQDFESFKILNRNSTYKEVMFNMMLVPALIEGLSKCQKMAETVDHLEEIGEEFNWFRSILLSYKKIEGHELTIDEFKGGSPALIAQKLLDKPFGKAIYKLANKSDDIDDGEDSYE